MDTSTLLEFGARYTEAWCSQDAARVAAFFAEGGSLTINGGAPAAGRAAIAASIAAIASSIGKAWRTSSALSISICVSLSGIKKRRGK